MGQKRFKDSPLDARERCAILYGEDAREFRVHLVRANRVDETIYVRAPGYTRAEQTALAFSSWYERATKDWRKVPEAIRPERFLVEPIHHCVDCGKEMVSPDPRTAGRTSTGEWPFEEREVDGEIVREPDPDGIRCLPCGAERFMRPAAA